MNSSLAHLKNYAPEDETRTMIWLMIQEREARLDSNRYLLEISRNQKEIASKAVERLRHQLAEAERAEVAAVHSFEAARKIVSDIEDTIAEHKALLHPIRYLPSDILCQIFECCTMDDNHEGNMAIAIRLSSVCRTWRLIAHSLGPLWGHIDYSLWNPSVKDIFEHFHKCSPYYLNVRVKVDRNWEPEPMSSAPFSLTNFQFDRIRTLTIYMSPDGLNRQLWSTTLHDLTRLTIYACLGTYHNILRGDCLRHCENLEELELEGLGISFVEDFVLQRLSRISWREDYHGYFTPLVLGRLFERAPHMKSFSFFSGYLVGPENVLLHAFRPLRELTSLRIECGSSRHSMVTLLKDSSLLPSLQHLTLSSTNISDLLDSVVQNAETVSLTKVTLEIYPDTDFAPSDGLVQRLMVLRRFQYLERLEVDAGGRDIWCPNPNYSEYFVNCLCEALSECDARPIFPSLRIIRFLRYEAASVNNIIEMVKARMVAARISPKMLAQLESVTFEDREPLNLDEYRRLKVVLGHNGS